MLLCILMYCQWSAIALFWWCQVALYSLRCNYVNLIFGIRKEYTMLLCLLMYCQWLAIALLWWCQVDFQYEYNKSKHLLSKERLQMPYKFYEILLCFCYNEYHQDHIYK